MTTTFRPVRAGLLAGAAVVALTSAAAYAQADQQQGAQSDDEIELIIVTAGRRAQNLREAATSVDVIQGNTLEDISAAGFEDYLRQAPSVQFNDAGASQTASISIRGVSTSTATGITQQTVGIYIDETPFTDVFSFLSSPDLTPFDLERVEILRGPQGALYGSGSMGGAIRYITAKPDFEEVYGKYNGLVSFTEGGGINTLNQGMINLPISDTLAVRAVVSYRTDDGFVDNLLVNENDVDDLNQIHARGSILWQPTERLSLLGRYIYQNSDIDGLSLIEDPEGEELTQSVAAFAELELEYQIANVEIGYEFDFADLLLSGSYAAKNRDTNGDSGPMSTNTTLLGFEAGLSATLGTIGAFTPGDLLAFGLDQNILQSQPTSDAYYVEARLTSKSDQRLRWLIGGLFTNVDNFNPIQQFVPGLNNALSSFTIPAPFDGIFGAPNAAVLFGVPESDQLLDFFQASEATEYAIYGELQFDITDKLELTAGGRYFDFDVETQIALAGAILADVDNDVSEFQPRVTLGYQADDDILLYAVFSRGYRVGGVNDTIAFTLAPGENIEDSPAPLTYDTDDLFNYEAGIKSTWLDGRLTADVGVYFIDWSDIQLSSFFPAPLSPAGGIAAISNVGDASIVGVEAQFVFQANDFVTFSSSVSFNDAELDEATPAVPDLETGALVSAPAGTQLPGSRRWQLANSITFNYNVGEVPVTLTASHQFASSTINDFVVQAPLGSYNLFDLRLDAQITSSIRAGIFARNLFDEREAVQLTPANPGFSPRAFAITRPRTIGANLSLDF